VFQGAEALPSLLRVLDEAGVTMHSINLSRPTLDDVFLTMTGRSLRDDSASAREGKTSEAAGDAAAAARG
jgi:ABC-2 type transport system ATP-binding protein